MADPVKIHIDIVSDVVCPWCIIGYRQLERALDELTDEVEAEIAWHPFELNRHMPPEGQDIGEHVREKYGATPEQSQGNRARLQALGEELGFPMHYAPGMRIYNTFKAHQLLHWAGEAHGASSQTALKLALFKAYFQDNRNVSDEDVLIDVAASTGLDSDEARMHINDPENEAAVRAHLDFWVDQGVSGVPAIIFERKFMVPGAQDSATFANVIRKVTAKKAAA